LFVFGVDKTLAAVCNCPAECIPGYVGTEAECKGKDPACTFDDGIGAACASLVPAVPVVPPSALPDPQVVKLANPLKGDVTEVAVLIGMIIKAGLSIVGALSLAVFVFGGFTWLTSAGNQEKVGKGAKTMLWAVLGLVVVFASYMLVAQLFKI